MNPPPRRVLRSDPDRDQQIVVSVDRDASRDPTERLDQLLLHRLVCEAGRTGHGERIRLVGVEMDLAVVVGRHERVLIDRRSRDGRHDLPLLQTLNPGADPS